MTQREVAGTRERILDTAEKLFLEKGFRGASLRALSSAAAVNLAAVGYHFGGKHELLRAVLERRVAPVNRERLRRLDAVEAGWRQGRAKTLEPVLEALLEPAFEAVRSGDTPRDTASLLYSEPLEEMRPLVESLFGECSRRFQAALGRVLGRGGGKSLELRFQMVIGAMIHFLAGHYEIAAGSSASARPASERETVDELLTFLSAGLRATAPARSRSRRARATRAPRAREISQ